MSLSKSRISAVAAVTSMNQARAFYEGKLGLKLQDDSTPNELIYECGDGTTLLLYLARDISGATSNTVAAWGTTDIDLEMDVLLSRGVEFEHHDQPGLKTDRRGVAEIRGRRVAWIRDPDGNTFAITQL